MKAIAASGRTIVFVSHNLESIKTICSRCILFEKGKLAMDGDVESVVAKHLESSSEPQVPSGTSASSAR